MESVESRKAIRVHLPENRGYSIFQRPLHDATELMQQHALRVGRCLIVTDQNVGLLYAENLVASLREDGWTPRIVTLPPGEASKSLPYLREIYDVALEWKVDRQTPVIALGGGVVGDIAGFAAATLLRGLPFIQLPTSLIAQVDSAIGGKTGINHESGKNLIGSFHQPVFVCSDVGVLHTLPTAEWASGLSEVVKHALIADASFLEWLAADMAGILERQNSIVPEMIERAATIKAAIVSEDERESGKRAILNFGHTFGHALEKVAGYGSLSHGDAVLVGMKAALHLSSRRHSKSDFSPAADLLSNLPAPDLPTDLQIDTLMIAMQSDKKVDAGRLRFVLLRSVGEAYVDSDISEADIMEAWHSVLS